MSLPIRIESKHQHESFFAKSLERNCFEFPQCDNPGVSFLCFLFFAILAGFYSVQFFLAFFDLLVS